MLQRAVGAIEDNACDNANKNILIGGLARAILCGGLRRAKKWTGRRGVYSPTEIRTEAENKNETLHCNLVQGRQGKQK